MNIDNKGEILVVDDEINALKVLSAILTEEGYEVFESKDVETAIKTIHRNNVDAIITDLKMPGNDGIYLFEYITKNYPDIPVIFLTAYGTVDSAVSAITRGAFYYFIKPPDYGNLKGILARAVEQRRLKKEIELLRKRLSDESIQYRIIGNSQEILKIMEIIEAIKDSTANVLICGETGTGKELIARALHYSSSRKQMPFITVNCAAIPRELLEAELFGYEKGAFTGATNRRIGRFEEAGGGTIFLDEIGELELSLQAKLLRVLQEREIERLGNNKKIKVNFRLLSSTNRTFKKEVETGNFREDLFYRVNVVQVDVPPLRERKNDISLLANEFVNEFCLREKKLLTISDKVMRSFHDYHWPGNIRELRNIVERAVVLAKKKEITLHELPKDFQGLENKITQTSSVKPLWQVEKQEINKALHECKGNKSKAARMLGISRKALYKRIEESQPLTVTKGNTKNTKKLRTQ